MMETETEALRLRIRLLEDKLICVLEKNSALNAENQKLKAQNIVNIAKIEEIIKKVNMLIKEF